MRQGGRVVRAQTHALVSAARGSGGSRHPSPTVQHRRHPLNRSILEAPRPRIRRQGRRGVLQRVAPQCSELRSSRPTTRMVCWRSR